MKKMNVSKQELVEKIQEIFVKENGPILGKEELEKEHIFFTGVKKNLIEADSTAYGYFFYKNGTLKLNMRYNKGKFFLNKFDFESGKDVMRMEDWDEMKREKEKKVVQLQTLQQQIEAMEDMLETQRLRYLFRK